MSKKKHTKPAELVEDLIERAKEHGEESEPDMEVGDLQEMLRRAWGCLTDYQQGRLHELLLVEIGYEHPKG